MKINLGSGRSPKKGYINCDNNPKAKTFTEAQGNVFRTLPHALVAVLSINLRKSSL